MKKTSINILCIAIIAILAGSILVPGIALVDGFAAGFNSSDKTQETYTPVMVHYNASSEDMFRPDSEVFSADGTRYPITYRTGIILVPDNKIPVWYTSTTIVCISIELILFIMLVVELIQFLININHNRIFDIRNVKRLRRFGIYLILIAIFQSVNGLTDVISVYSLNISSENTPLTAIWSIPWGNLLLGLLALLLSQIWSMGLQMKKEQELTI